MGKWFILYTEEPSREGGFCVIGCRKRRVVHTISKAGVGPGVKNVRCIGVVESAGK